MRGVGPGKYGVADSDDEDIIFSRQGKVVWCVQCVQSVRPDT